MAVSDILDWMEEYSGGDYVWYIKRLSGNDTLANKSHQAGPYVPKQLLFDLFPSIQTETEKNPREDFDLFVDSHSDHQQVTAIYYNNKFFQDNNGKWGTRNEARLTNFGGASSALLDPDSTGALTIFAFLRNKHGVCENCHVWVCRHETEEDVVEDRVGPVEPGTMFIHDFNDPDLFGPLDVSSSCWLKPYEIPADWLTSFPTGLQIIEKALGMQSSDSLPIDERLIKRRECEYQIFRSVEEAVSSPLIRDGFERLDDFIAVAQSILQRRKSRSGRSLELHTKAIFDEENLNQGHDYDHQPTSEPGKKPDFLFPSQARYHDSSFPDSKLRMLAVKTSCKDRWRQILNEASRIETKHLLTLQEGVSENQFREMQQANVQLVVPQPLMKKFPKSLQTELQTLESFIGDVRLLRI